MPRVLQSIVGCGLAFVLTGIAGCGGGPAGPSLAGAKGKVLRGGKPVAGATVQFVVPNSPIGMGISDQNGEFSITTGGRRGAVVGNAKVAVIKPSSANENQAPSGPPDPSKIAEMMAQRQNDAMKKTQGKPFQNQKSESDIPPKYASPESSGLEATVVANESENVFEFNLID